MEFAEEFKLLKLEKFDKKNVEGLKDNEKFFIVVHVLDKVNNPVKFFSFNSEINEMLINSWNNESIKGLQDCIISFSLSFVNNMWNVKLLDIKFD